MRMRQRTEYDKRIIGRNLRRFREAKKLSIEEVRRYLCVGSLQAVYKWEEGRCYPQTDTLLALLELYEVEWRDIVREEEADSGYMPVKAVSMYQISDKERIREYYRALTKEYRTA